MCRRRPEPTPTVASARRTFVAWASARRIAEMRQYQSVWIAGNNSPISPWDAHSVRAQGRLRRQTVGGHHREEGLVSNAVD